MSHQVRTYLALLLAVSPCACGALPAGSDNSDEVESSSEALSGNIVLTSGSNSSGGYDFSAQAYKDISRGDFYFLQGVFWANNTGQRGVIDVGACSSIYNITTMPASGYSRFGVSATVGRCYVSLTHNDERNFVVFRVGAKSTSTVSLSWRMVTTAWGGATLTSNSGTSSGYDFDAKTYKGNSGGDFYFLNGAFWANNLGQRGLVSTGACSSVDGVRTVPLSGYSTYSVPAVAGNCYVSLAHNEERGNIVFRVESVSTSAVALSFKMVDDCYGLSDFSKHPNCWLTKNGSIAKYIIWENRLALGSSTPVVWSQWSNAQRDDLRQNIVNYQGLLANTLTQDPDPLVDPPTNLATLQDTEFPVLVLSASDAWRLYVKTVAMSLAVELTRYVPWSVTGYAQTSLSALFDSRNMLTYTWSGRPADLGVNTPSAEGYMVVANNYDSTSHTTLQQTTGYTTPSPPDVALKFTRAKSFKGTTRLATIQNAIDWSRRLRHFDGSSSTADFQRIWGYRGPAPVTRTIATTIDPNDSPDPYHYTAGCHGTSEFLHSVLRTLNIPVDRNVVAAGLAHSITRFQTENLYLSHGDDPYFRADPYGVPTSAMLLPESTYQEWFVATPSSTRHLSVGRQCAENYIRYLSPALQFWYCQDPPGTPPANSGVLNAFNYWRDIYTVSYLQNLPVSPSNPQASLWDRLASKIAAAGGCATVMSSINQQINACSAVVPVAERLATCLW